MVAVNLVLLAQNCLFRRCKDERHWPRKLTRTFVSMMTHLPGRTWTRPIETL